MQYQVYNILICLLIECMMASSCLKNQDDTSSGPKAKLAMANYLVNAAGIQGSIDGNKINLNPLAFGESTDNNGSIYYKVGPGLHNLTITSGTEIILDNTLLLDADKSYSLIVFDSLQEHKAVLLNDDLTPDSMAKARFLHVIPGGDTLTAVLTKESASLLITKTYLGTAPDAGLNSAFNIVLSPGIYRLQLVSHNTVIYRQDSVAIRQGNRYTFIARGVSGGSGSYREGITIMKHD